MREFLTRFLKNDRGATAIEYGLILALVAIAMIGALQGLAGTTTAMWDYVDTNVTTST